MRVICDRRAAFNCGRRGVGTSSVAAAEPRGRSTIRPVEAGADDLSPAGQPAEGEKPPRRLDGNEPARCHVFHQGGSERMHFDRETVERLLASGQFFWLDLDKPGPRDFEILRDVFKFHPLAVEDSEHFGQRAKIDDYDDFVFLVVYGAVARRGPARRGALLLLGALPRHRPPRRLPRPSPRSGSATTKRDEADRRSRRCCSTGSSTGSSTASSRSSPSSTTASTSSRTRSS